MDDLGLKISEDDEGLPPANPKFRGPALGGRWEPDYNKYPPWLAAQLQKALEKAIYD